MPNPVTSVDVVWNISVKVVGNLGVRVQEESFVGVSAAFDNRSDKAAEVHACFRYVKMDVIGVEQVP